MLDTVCTRACMHAWGAVNAHAAWGAGILKERQADLPAQAPDFPLPCRNICDRGRALGRFFDARPTRPTRAAALSLAAIAILVPDVRACPPPPMAGCVAAV